MYYICACFAVSMDLCNRIIIMNSILTLILHVVIIMISKMSTQFYDLCGQSNHDSVQKYCTDLIITL